MITESWNLIEPEAYLASTNQKWKIHMLSSIDAYLQAKKTQLRYELIHLRDIVD